MTGRLHHGLATRLVARYVALALLTSCSVVGDPRLDTGSVIDLGPCGSAHLRGTAILAETDSQRLLSVPLDGASPQRWIGRSVRPLGADEDYLLLREVGYTLRPGECMFHGKPWTQVLEELQRMDVLGIAPGASEARPVDSSHESEVLAGLALGDTAKSRLCTIVARWPGGGMGIVGGFASAPHIGALLQRCTPSESYGELRNAEPNLVPVHASGPPSARVTWVSEEAFVFEDLQGDTLPADVARLELHCTLDGTATVTSELFYVRGGAQNWRELRQGLIMFLPRHSWIGPERDLEVRVSVGEEESFWVGEVDPKVNGNWYVYFAEQIINLVGETFPESDDVLVEITQRPVK